jgi:phage terminase large subunit
VELKLKATNVFERNYDAYKKGTRFVVNQGGTGSSKTWSLAQLFLILLLREERKVMTIVRKTLPALKATSINDLVKIMNQHNIYNLDNHNKSDLYFEYNGNKLEYFAVDDPQKVRSRRRDYLWMNEANEFKYEDFKQLNMRTSKQVFMDFNPSDQFHWIYDEIKTREDCLTIKSTYKDNPYLNKQVVNEIEEYKNLDQNYWRIYGLGERGVSQTTVYSHWELVDKLPEGGDVIYGLDFGYNHPSALVKVVIKDDKAYVKELLYESHLTNQQLIDKIKELVDGNKYIYCDSAEPDRIEEMIQAGLNAKPAYKSVSDGIDTVKSHHLYITKDSVNLLKEIKSYSWKEKNEKPIDEPVKANDHCMDSKRYAIATYFKEPKVSLDII